MSLNFVVIARYIPGDMDSLFLQFNLTVKKAEIWKAKYSFYFGRRIQRCNQNTFSYTILALFHNSKKDCPCGLNHSEYTKHIYFANRVIKKWTGYL